MKAILGQATATTGVMLGGVLQLLLSVAVLTVILGAGLAWRLDAGPLEVAWLARGLERLAVDQSRVRVTVGGAALAWKGWRDGPTAPLDLRLTQIAADTPGSDIDATIARAEFAIAIDVLALGRIAPRRIEIERALLHVRRNAGDGSWTDSLRSLGRGRGIGDTGGSPTLDWSQLDRLRVAEAALTVSDRILGVDWSVERVEFDVQRAASGGLTGQGGLQAVVGAERITLDATASPSPDGGTGVQLRLTRLNPSRFAALLPALAPAAALDADVTLALDATLDVALNPATATLHAEVGSGTLRPGPDPATAVPVPLFGGVIDASLNADRTVVARLDGLRIAARPDGRRSTIAATIAGRRQDGRVFADVTVEIDQADFADLAVLWPVGVGGRGGRKWVTENITTGLARNFRVSVGLDAAADFSDQHVRSLAGGGDATDLTVYWLRPVPPLVGGTARLSFVDPETIDIAVLGARQVVGAGSGKGDAKGLIVTKGDVRIVGILDKDQTADIEGDIAGGVADLGALLKHPRLHLLDKRPDTFRDAGGRLTGHLSVNPLPLEDKVSIDDIRIAATTHISDLRLTGIVAGRDLDRGTVDLQASNDGLHASGSVRVAGIPSKLTTDLDFRGGGPSQVVAKVSASGTVDDKMLASLGLDAAPFFVGAALVDLAYMSQRDGHGSITAHADLARATIAVGRANLRKGAGRPARADLRVQLDHDRIASIDRISVTGDGIAIDGAAEVAEGRPSVLHLRQVKIGATTDVTGELRLPATKADAYMLAVNGPTLDLSGLIGAEKTPASVSKRPRPRDGGTEPSFVLNARLDRIVLGDGRAVTGFAAHWESERGSPRRAHVQGRTSPSAPFELTITPDATGRDLRATAANTGELLRAFDLSADVVDGRARVDGRYDDRAPGQPLAGTAELTEFRVRGTAALGKILQAATLYGLVDALSGPGLNFTRLTAPFRWSGGTLTLTEARAFSSSLGMTAKGTIDTEANTAAIEGTVVPAYFFNTLLGRLPLVGKLFSPEQGGGVFAVTYGVHGPLANPTVRVNPLSALTPGFLRGLFDIF